MAIWYFLSLQSVSLWGCHPLDSKLNFYFYFVFVMHQTGKDKGLSWIQRLEIAIDSARGLLFLHSYPEGCIVHRDIKVVSMIIFGAPSHNLLVIFIFMLRFPKSCAHVDHPIQLCMTICASL